MSREELKEIIQRILERLEERRPRETPQPACVFNDGSCDATTMYAVGEEG